MNISQLCAFAILILSIAGDAKAWSETGHKVIASIAFRQLDPAAQAKIVAILKSHPRYSEDFAAQMPPSVAAADAAAQNEWFFQQAAIWPDMARGFLDDAKKTYHHATWHYIDIPSYLTETDRATIEKKLTINMSLDAPAEAQAEMNAVQAIRFARKSLLEPQGEASQQAVLLCWLLHDIGDLHQPLHSTAMFSARLFPEGDRGGNAISTQQGFNLHSLWDQFLGDWATFSMARDRAKELLGRPESAKIGKEAARALDEAVWLNESRQLAESAVYSPEVLGYLRIQETRAGDQPPPPLRLSEDYLGAGVGIATGRVQQAGFRLAAVLDQIAAR
jgi:hypothetical protein